MAEVHPIEKRSLKDNAQEFRAMVPAEQNAGRVIIAPQNMGEVLDFAKMMALSKAAVPAHLRGNASDCLAVAMLAYRIGVDPFGLAQKSYKVSDTISYEAQAVIGALNASGILKGRLKLDFQGQGEELTCTVSGRLRDDPDEVYISPPIAIKGITTRNSPNWKQQPAVQLGYYAQRAWARLYCPEVMMGLTAVDDLTATGASVGNAPPRPTEEDVIDIEVEELPVIDLHDEFGGVIYQTTSWAEWVDEYARHYAKAVEPLTFREFNEENEAEACCKVGNADAIFAELHQHMHDDVEDVDPVSGHESPATDEPSDGADEAPELESDDVETEGGSDEVGEGDVPAEDHVEGQPDGSEDQTPQAPSLHIPLEFIRNKPDLTGWYIKATAAVDTLSASQVDGFREQNKDALARLRLGRKATFEALNKKLEGLA